MDLTKARALVAKHHWKHSFELIPGLITGGDWGFIDSAKLLDETYGVPKDLKGARALDIGALDGVHTFELERRGADVTAIDIQSPDVTGFNLAKSINGSKAKYIQGDVYNLTSIFEKNSFDVILYFGVWYHLKNPVKAMEEVAAILKPSGFLCAEGAVLKQYVELDGKKVSEDEIELIKKMADSSLGISIYHSGVINGDLWNWYVPNKACVNEWLKTAGLSLERHGWWDQGQHQRLHLRAVKDGKHATTVDNPVF
jgi:tRNA (mo5U34)-methyltransferase